MKRVAIFRSDLLPLSETFIRDQANALKSWEPILVGYKRIKGGLDTPSIQQEIIPKGNLKILDSLRFWLSIPNYALTTRLKQLDVDLVHAHFGTDATDIWPSVLALGLPMLITLHGYDINTHKEWWEAGHAGLRRRKYPRKLLEMSQHPKTHFIAVSHYIKRRAIEFGIPEEKITVAYVGVDTNRFKPGGQEIAKRGRVILFIGRMVENKNPILLVNAFSKISQKINNAELVMIGDGPLRSEVESLAKSLKANIRFLGALSGDAILQHLNHAKALCLPSQKIASGASEGFGLTLIEAQSCGVPVIASKTGGIVEAVTEGLTGFLFNAENQQELEEILINVLTLPEQKIADLSTAARNFACDLFDISKLCPAIEETYEKMTAEKTTKRDRKQ